MPLHDIAFYVAGFFLIGVFISSSKFGLPIIILTAVLAVFLFLLIGYLKQSKKFFWLAGLTLFVIAGAIYSNWYNSHQIENINIDFGRKVNFSGIVIENPERGNLQKLVINLQAPYAGRALVKLQQYPNFDYGDLIQLNGSIFKPEPVDYAEYLAKDRIFGVANFPKAEIIKKNQASALRSILFKLKQGMVWNFGRVLSLEQAAFLSGITLGERADFSKELKEAMSKSGTTHLVALSGYNISIIVIAAFALFSYFLSRRLTFLLTTIIIIGFVLMTGAEASVVRAAIMGFLAMLASQVSRVYGMRNIVALTAFFMVLINPKVLRFDIGFQLSFLALLGIVYLLPALRNLFRLKEEQGFLGWRENFLTTTAAQLAVAPILISNFNQFSPTSLLANVLILEFIPPTMFLGFLIGIFGFVSAFFSQIFGWFASLFLGYELGVINLFGKINFSIPQIGFWGALVYYIILIGFIIYSHKWFGLTRDKNVQT